jgi:hypothetical protein
VPTRELIGQRLCLLLTGTDDAGEPEWVIFPGTVVSQPDGLYLDRAERGPLFELREEWHPRIKPVPPELEQVCQGAAYYLRLTVGRAEDEPDHETFLPTGLRRPPKRSVED